MTIVDSTPCKFLTPAGKGTYFLRLICKISWPIWLNGLFVFRLCWPALLVEMFMHYLTQICNFNFLQGIFLENLLR